MKEEKNSNNRLKVLCRVLLIFVLLPKPIPQVIYHLTTCHITIIEGPIEKNGAYGSLFSIYILDPAGNLIEIATEIKA